MGAKEAEEGNVTRERLPRTSPDYSSSSDSSLSETSASLFLFCGSTFFSFRSVLSWPRLKLVPPWTRAPARAPWFVCVFLTSIYHVAVKTTSFPVSSLFLPRESTLVAAGHVSARFLQIPDMWLKGGAGKLKFFSVLSLPTEPSTTYYYLSSSGPWGPINP